jgi:hypothetical protein
MTIREELIQGWAKAGSPAPEFLVRYLPTNPEPIIISVHSAMGERLGAEHHPRFKYWLNSHLKKNKSTTAA